jgi:hypothetical protein
MSFSFAVSSRKTDFVVCCCVVCFAFFVFLISKHSSEPRDLHSSSKLKAFGSLPERHYQEGDSTRDSLSQKYQFPFVRFLLTPRFRLGLQQIQLIKSLVHTTRAFLSPLLPFHDIRDAILVNDFLLISGRGRAPKRIINGARN